MKIRMILIQRLSIAIALLAIWTGVASAQSTSASTHAATSLVVQVQPGININQIASQFGFTVTRGLNSPGTGQTYVITGNGNLTALEQALTNTKGINWVTGNNKVHVKPLDDGENVLPLDCGENVLPLDGGENVLPLGPGIPTVTTATIQTALSSVLQTLNGGANVLPLDGNGDVLSLSQIQAAYAKVASMTVGSPALILQPAFGKIGFYGAVLNSSGKGITIADLDTGADTCHPALSGIFTYNFTTEAVDPENCPAPGVVPGPGFGHGTEVASLLNVLAPGSKLWVLRIFDSNGTADVATVYDATVWAVNHGVNIINMSFGAGTDSPALNDAIAYATANGVLVSGAAGNSDQNAVMYPAAIQQVLATASTDITDQKSSFSNYNSGINVSAPGSQLVTAYPGNRWAIVKGTSFAAPIVAADAALVEGALANQYNHGMSTSYLNNVIQSGVDNISSENPQYRGELGSGRINMWKALNLVNPTPNSNWSPNQ